MTLFRGGGGLGVQRNTRRVDAEGQRPQLRLEAPSAGPALSRAQARLLVQGAQALDAAIGAVHAQAAREAGAERSTILLFDAAGRGTLDRYWAAPGTAAPGFTRLELPWMSRELRAERSVVFARTDALPAQAEADRRTLEEQHIRSGMLIPLRTTDAQALGWINFVTLQREQAWTRAQVEAAEHYGALLAAALLRLRAERERDEELRTHALLAAISRAFLDFPPERSLEGVNATLRLVAEHLGAFRGSAWELTGDGQSLRLLGQWRHDASALPTQVPVNSAALSPVLRAHLERNEAWCVPHLDLLPPGSAEDRARLEGWGIGSFLAIPLRTGEREVGWLTFSKPVPAPWPRAFVGRTQLVGDLVSAVLLRARDAQRVIEVQREADTARAVMQATLDALSAQVALTDAQGRILAVNEAWRRAQQPAAKSRNVGSNYLDYCRELSARMPEAAQVLQGVEQLLRGELHELRLAYQCPLSDDTHWYQLRVTCFLHAGQQRLVFAHEDVTELKQAEEQLRELAGELLQVQDSERRRIASVLHDGAAQAVFAGVMGVRSAQRQAHPASAELAESREVLEEALLQLRTLSHLLHPPLLDEAGLGAALRLFLDGVSTRSGLALTLEGAEGLERLPPETEHALFRMVQEALLNVQRHSGAARAQVRLEQDEGGVRVSVCDQGHGFSAAALPMRPTVGLASMRQRLLQVGGSLEVHSGPGGTEVRARVPRSAPTPP